MVLLHLEPHTTARLTSILNLTLPTPHSLSLAHVSSIGVLLMDELLGAKRHKVDELSLPFGATILLTNPWLHRG